MTKKSIKMQAQDILATACCNLLNSFAKVNVGADQYIPKNVYKIILLIGNQYVELTRDQESMFREWETGEVDLNNTQLKQGWNRIFYPTETVN